MLERVDSATEPRLGQPAVFEGAVVALNGGLGSRDFSLQTSEPGCGVGFLLGGTRSPALYGSADDLCVRVRPEQRLENRLVEQIRPQDVGTAALPAVAIPREARVVAVAVAAAVSGRADISPSTSGTHD
jgi:hypothetical protein